MEVWKVTGRMDIHGSMEGDWEDCPKSFALENLSGWLVPLV